MGKRIAMVLAAAMLCGTPALADGKVFVQLPDLSSYSGTQAEDFLRRVVLANVVSSNCAGFGISDAEWSLLTDSADLLAYGRLRLDTDSYDDAFYGPAFDALDAPGTCETHGPDVEAVLEELVRHGGAREPLPDQEGAYEEWRALMDRLQAEAGAASAPVKVKTK